MALSKDDDRKCWQIKRNLNRFHEKREQHRQKATTLLAEIDADKEKLFRLRLEEGLIIGEMVLTLPVKAEETATLLGAGFVFYQLNLEAEALTRVWAEIEAAKLSIETKEKEFAPLESRIAEFTRLMAESWEAFEKTPCELRHLPVGVPRY